MFVNKKGYELEALGKWLIVIAAIILLVFVALILKAKGIDALEYVKNVFRFK